jgi:hypothetical protein
VAGAARGNLGGGGGAAFTATGEGEGGLRESGDGGDALAGD